MSFFTGGGGTQEGADGSVLTVGGRVVRVQGQCPVCAIDVVDGRWLGGLIFHDICGRCQFCCEKVISNTFSLLGGKLSCNVCMARTVVCSRCHDRFISDAPDALVLRGRHFHAACATCSSCSKPLPTPGERAYDEISEIKGELVCGACIDRVRADETARILQRQAEIEARRRAEEQEQAEADAREWERIRAVEREGEQHLSQEEFEAKLERESRLEFEEYQRRQRHERELRRQEERRERLRQEELERQEQERLSRRAIWNENATTTATTSSGSSTSASSAPAINTPCPICEVDVFQGTVLGGRLFHDVCARCSECYSRLSPSTFSLQRGKLFCVDCKPVVLGQCPTCKVTIESRGSTRIEPLHSRFFHPDCRKCSTCSASVTSASSCAFDDVDQVLRCSACQGKVLAEREAALPAECIVCHQASTVGETAAAPGGGAADRWHAACAICVRCSLSLVDPPSPSYAFLENGLHCDACTQALKAPPSPTASEGSSAASESSSPPQPSTPEPTTPEQPPSPAATAKPSPPRSGLTTTASQPKKRPRVAPQPFANAPYIPRRLREIVTCPACLGELVRKDGIELLNETWHVRCARCSVCAAPMNESTVGAMHDGRKWCITCYGIEQRRKLETGPSANELEEDRRMREAAELQARREAAELQARLEAQERKLRLESQQREIELQRLQREREEQIRLEALRQEEEMQRRLDELRKREMELRVAEEARRLEEERRRKEEELLRLADQERQRWLEEERRRKQSEDARKELELRKREQQLRQREEELRRLEEQRRREAELQAREAELARREAEIRRMELEQRRPDRQSPVVQSQPQAQAQPQTKAPASAAAPTKAAATASAAKPTAASIASQPATAKPPTASPSPAAPAAPQRQPQPQPQPSTAKPPASSSSTPARTPAPPAVAPAPATTAPALREPEASSIPAAAPREATPAPREATPAPAPASAPTPPTTTPTDAPDALGGIVVADTSETPCPVCTVSVYDGVRLGGMLFHAVCARCQVCSSKISKTTPFSLQDGQMVCASCQTHVLGVCPVCQLAVRFTNRSGRALQLYGTYYHPECAKCAECSTALKLDSVHEQWHDGRILCGNCARVQRAIEEGNRIASCGLCSGDVKHKDSVFVNRERWHVECAVCSECRTPLSDSGSPGFATTAPESKSVICNPCIADKEAKAKAALKAEKRAAKEAERLARIEQRRREEEDRKAQKEAERIEREAAEQLQREKQEWELKDRLQREEAERNRVVTCPLCFLDLVKKDGVELIEQIWHRDCTKCCICSSTVRDQRNFGAMRQGRLWCHSCDEAELKRVQREKEEALKKLAAESMMSLFLKDVGETIEQMAENARSLMPESSVDIEALQAVMAERRAAAPTMTPLEYQQHCMEMIETRAEKLRKNARAIALQLWKCEQELRQVQNPESPSETIDLEHMKALSLEELLEHMCTSEADDAASGNVNEIEDAEDLSTADHRSNLTGTRYTMGRQEILQLLLGNGSKALQLPQADIHGENLAYIRLNKCNLAAANLARANLLGSVLDRCEFRFADLTHVNLKGVTITNSSFFRTRMMESDMALAVIGEGCSISRTKMNASVLNRATFAPRTTLTEVDLEAASMVQAKLVQVAFVRSNLRAVDCSRSNLTRATMHATDCTGAIFDGADLSYANLSTAVLVNCSFKGAKLHKTKFFDLETGNRAIMNDSTLEGADTLGALLTPEDYQVVSANKIQSALKSAANMDNIRAYTDKISTGLANAATAAVAGDTEPKHRASIIRPAGPRIDPNDPWFQPLDEEDAAAASVEQPTDAAGPPPVVAQ